MVTRDFEANDRFRAARNRQGLSRQELADAANQHPAMMRSADGPMTENFIAKLEQGRIALPRTAERREALRAVLKVATDAEIGLIKTRRRPTDSFLKKEPVDAPPSTIPFGLSTLSTLSPRDLGYPLRDPGYDGSQLSTSVWLPTSRIPVSYVPFLPAALDGPALDWLVGGDSRRTFVGGDDRRQHADEVMAVADRLDELRGLDHRLGAGTVYPLVADFLRVEVRPMLARGPGDSETQSLALTVALGAYELAGYQAVDLGADGLAQQHYVHALTLTRAGGERPYGAYLLAVSLGHLALHCGYPRHALRMAQTAIKGVAGSVTPLVNAALHAVLGRAFARLGDESQSTEALIVAQREQQRCDPVSEPAWVRYLTPAYLADEVAHCLFDLGHHESAQREVRAAMAGVGPTRVRRLAIDTALLASSLARNGQIDEACVRAREAADLSHRTTSMRAVQRVAQVRQDLIPFDRRADVAASLDYLHEALPAAG